MGRLPSELSKTSETSATFTGRRPVDPWKITSSILPPRSSRGDCSPSTQRTASEMLDFPHPFGPTMAVTPSSKGSSTEPANDLKPDSSSLLSLMGSPPHAGEKVRAHVGARESGLGECRLVGCLECAEQDIAVGPTHGRQPAPAQRIERRAGGGVVGKGREQQGAHAFGNEAAAPQPRPGAR